MDIDLPEVQAYATKARFFRKDDKDYVEISMVGHTDTLVKKVTPDLMARYREEWNAHCDGVPMQPRKGTPLTELKEITEERAADLVRRNVHTLEELAALSDHQCQGLGHGTITLRKQAQALVMRREFEAKEADHKRVAEVAYAAPAKEHHPEMQALQTIVEEQAKKIDALIALVAQQAEPRKKKKNGAKQHTGNNVSGV